jgi:hypothetical protein
MNDATIQSLITGFVSGIVSSATFSVIIYNLRPRFKISPFISASTDENGVTNYRFKIVNVSFFQVNDLELSLDIVRSRRGGFRRFRRDGIELSRNSLTYVPRYWPYGKLAKYALQIRTKDDSSLSSWHDDDYLILSVSGKHGLSGLNGSESQKFYKSDVKPGQFYTGNNLNVYN